MAFIARGANLQAINTNGLEVKACRVAFIYRIRMSLMIRPRSVWSISCGRIGGKPDAQLQAFANAAQAAGIDIALSDAIDRNRPIRAS